MQRIKNFFLGKKIQRLIPKFIHLLKNGKKCTIHGEGKTRRNFIHAYDVATAVECILNSNVINDIINIGTNNEYSVMEITQKIVKYLYNEDNVKNYIEFVEDRPFNDFRYSINNEKLKNLGWKEVIDFEEGLKKLV